MSQDHGISCPYCIYEWVKDLEHFFYRECMSLCMVWPILEECDAVLIGVYKNNGSYSWIPSWTGFDYGQISIETATHSWSFHPMKDRFPFCFVWDRSLHFIQINHHVTEAEALAWKWLTAHVAHHYQVDIRGVMTHSVCLSAWVPQWAHKYTPNHQAS